MALSPIRTFLQDLRSHQKTAFQTSTLFGSKLGLIALGLLIKGIQTRALSPESYGYYAFFVTVTAFTALFFRFGYFSSLKVLLANNKDPDRERSYYGLGIITGIIISILYILFLILISYFIDDWFQVKIGAMLRILSPLCLVFPLQHLLTNMAIGSNKVQHSAWFDIGAKLLFVIPLAILFFLENLTLYQILWLNMLSAMIAMIIIFLRFRPSFQNLKECYLDLCKKQREYGRYFFTGNLANQATFKLDGIVISYFLNTTLLGYYTLASIICSPMVLLSQSLTASLFKNFATRDRIPKKLFVYNMLWLGLCILFLALLSGILVKLLFGAEYSIVAKYIFPLSVAYLFQGLYQPFSFLAVKSRGKEIRNVALLESAINVAGYFSLIFIFGIYGVILTSILAKLMHFLGLYYYYQKDYK